MARMAGTGQVFSADALLGSAALVAAQHEISLQLSASILNKEVHCPYVLVDVPFNYSMHS
jgi:hypothetical protein